MWNLWLFCFDIVSQTCHKQYIECMYTYCNIQFANMIKYVYVNNDTDNLVWGTSNATLAEQFFMIVRESTAGTSKYHLRGILESSSVQQWWICFSCYKCYSIATGPKASRRDTLCTNLEHVPHKGGGCLPLPADLGYVKSNVMIGAISIDFLGQFTDFFVCNEFDPTSYYRSVPCIIWNSDLSTTVHH